MMDFEFINPVVSAKLVLTLLHTLWQIAVLAVLTSIIERYWRQQSVERIYLLHVGVLCMAMVLVPVTYFLVELPAVDINAARQPLVTVSESAASSNPTVEVTSTTEIAPSVAAVEHVVLEGFASTTSVRSDGAVVAPAVTGPFKPWLAITPYITILYLLGVIVMLSRFALAIAKANRIGALAVPITSGPLVAKLRSLSQQWSVNGVPVIAQAEHIVVPQIVGLIRPTILLPTPEALTSRGARIDRDEELE